MFLLPDRLREYFERKKSKRRLELDGQMAVELQDDARSQGRTEQEGRGEFGRIRDRVWLALGCGVGFILIKGRWQGRSRKLTN